MPTPLDYAALPVTSAIYKVADTTLEIIFDSQTDVSPFIGSDLSFNIYYLYPSSTPDSAALLGTYNVSGDFINYDDNPPVIQQSVVIPIGGLDFATNQAFTSGSGNELLILPYEYAESVARGGAPDPLPSIRYAPEYYTQITVVAPSPHPVILSALQNTVTKDIMVTMEIFGLSGLFAHNNVFERVIYTNDAAHFFSPYNTGYSYLILDNITSNIGGSISISADGVGGSVTPVSIEGDILYNQITGTVNDNNGPNGKNSFTLTFQNTLDLTLSYIIRSVSEAGAVEYITGSVYPDSTVKFTMPANLNSTNTLFSQASEGSWSTPQTVTIPGPTTNAGDTGNPTPTPTPTPTPAPYVSCFFASAPVLTPSGYRCIGSLAAGDKVMTGDGRAVAIERIHRSRVAAAPTTNPYVIPKGQYGATRRLQISPNHRVQTASGMIEARHMGLEQEKLTGTLDYYNLELSAASDTMVVAGVTVESMAPVRRITVPFAVFREMITKKYGAMTPALIEKIKRTCRFLENGHVDCPGFATK